MMQASGTQQEEAWQFDTGKLSQDNNKGGTKEQSERKKHEEVTFKMTT